MQSGTNAPVVNCLFKTWLNVKIRGETAVNATRYREGCNLGMETVIRYGNIINNQNETQIYLTRDFWRLVLAVLLQCAAIIALLLMIFSFTGEWHTALIIIVNMWSYFSITFLIAIDGFYTTSSTPSPGTSNGNCVVTDTWGGKHLGNQRKRETDSRPITEGYLSKKNEPSLLVQIYRKMRGFFKFIMGVFGCCTTIATVLVTPLMSTKG